MNEDLSLLIKIFPKTTECAFNLSVVRLLEKSLFYLIKLSEHEYLGIKHQTARLAIMGLGATTFFCPQTM